MRISEIMPWFVVTLATFFVVSEALRLGWPDRAKTAFRVVVPLSVLVLVGAYGLTPPKTREDAARDLRPCRVHDQRCAVDAVSAGDGARGPYVGQSRQPGIASEQDERAPSSVEEDPRARAAELERRREQERQIAAEEEMRRQVDLERRREEERERQGRADEMRRLDADADRRRQEDRRQQDRELQRRLDDRERALRSR